MIKQITNWLHRHFYWAVVLQLILILIVFMAVRAWQLRDAIAGMAPDIQAELSSQQSFKLGQFHGRPALIYFWASWCPMCKMTNDNIVSIAEDYQVVSIASWSGKKDEVVDYMQEAGINMPVIIDDEGYWAREYNVKGVPTSFLIDPSGEIQFIESGYSSEFGLRLRLWWLSKKS